MNRQLRHKAQTVETQDEQKAEAQDTYTHLVEVIQLQALLLDEARMHSEHDVWVI